MFSHGCKVLVDENDNRRVHVISRCDRIEKRIARQVKRSNADLLVLFLQPQGEKYLLEIKLETRIIIILTCKETALSHCQYN